MGILDGLAPVAQNLLGTFGRTIKLRTYSESYNPITGTNTVTALDYTVKGLVEDYPARDTLGGSTTEGGIVRGDKKVTISALALTALGAPDPTTDTKVVLGTTEYSIVKIDEQFGTDEVLYHVLQSRR